MKKSLKMKNYYIFSTSIDHAADPDEFIVEVYSPNEAEENLEPKKVIRNFDELITFFESFDDSLDEEE